MMKNVFLLAACIASSIAYGQSPLKLARAANPIADLQSVIIEVDGLASDNELDYYLFTINEGATDLDLKVIRTEMDVLAGTENATCWKVCPNPVVAGTQPVFVSSFSEIVAAGDTNTTFSAHYYPKNLDGCSLFKYEWVDATDNSIVYGTIMMKFSHSTSQCVVGVEEDNVSFEMYPNPADAEVNFKVEGATGELEYEVLNLLGQKEVSVQLGAANNSIVKVNTTDLSNGVYFVAIKSNGRVIKTEKLVVKH